MVILQIFLHLHAHLIQNLTCRCLYQNPIPYEVNINPFFLKIKLSKNILNVVSSRCRKCEFLALVSATLGVTRALSSFNSHGDFNRNNSLA